MNPTSSLAIVLAADPDTPLTRLLVAFDRYALEMDLSDAGTPAPWATVLAWETAAQVQDWAAKAAEPA